MKKATRKSYSSRDLAEARAWAKGRGHTDGDNYWHPLDKEDPELLPQIAELIAKVRRRTASRVRQELSDNRALAESLGAYK